jgi:CHAT domain-containing protein
MKKFALVLTVTFVIINLQAQSNIEKKIDSLMTNASYDQALKLIRTQNRSIVLSNKEAEILMVQGNLTEAEKVVSEINSQGDPFFRAVTESNIGFLYLLKGRSDLALESLQQARGDFNLANQENSKENARCLSNLSLVYWSTGKLNQAEENALAALQLRQTIFGNESEEAAASLNDLGLVYGQTDPEKALTYYEQALAIYEKLHPGDHPKIAIAKTNIGLMYLKTQLYGDAINNFESAQTIWQKIYPSGHPNEALALVNLGRTYSQMKDDKAALGYYEKALAIYKKSAGEKHPDIASVYNQIGNIKLSENKFEDALADFQEAVCANSPSFNDKSIIKNPPVTNFYNGKVLLFSLQSKAQALETQHYGKTLKLQDLTLALKTLQACDTLVDIIRRQSENENDKIELGSLANDVYEDGVRLSISISEITVHSRMYREIAFYFSEKSKSAVLQESIADAQARSFAGIPGGLLDEEKTKKSVIVLLAQKISEKPSPEVEKKLRQELFKLTTAYELFVKKLEKDYPDYYNLKFKPTIASVRDIQKTLLPDQAVISYFIAEKKHRLYQFVVTTRNFKVRNRHLNEDFDRNCKGLSNSLLYNDFNTYKSTQSLSKILTPSLPHSIKNLIIIPSGRLSTIPFEALTDKKIKSQEFKDVSFFINRWAISYEFAAGLMLLKGKEKNTNSQGGIFLFAPINFDNQNIDDLPGTEKEVNSISTLFAGKSKVSTFRDANEELVKSKELNSYDYLHFATHGKVDVTDPALSEIFLNGKNNEDGNLYCGEIYNLTINADLVVLSACETGLGKISKGEGVIGLSRALVYAGAKNIIVSFWKVADESTAQLMVDFYRILLQNQNRDFSEALRQAKLDLIKGTQYASPYYWAPFVLIGK